MKKIRFILIILIVVVASYFITAHTPSLSDGTALIIRDDFLLSFLGIFSGFAIAIITFVYSNSIKTKQLILNNEELDAKNKVNKKYDSILLELKQDTMLIFISLICCFFLILIREANILRFKNINTLISKQQIISSLQLSFIFLTFISILDIMGTLFRLSKIYPILESYHQNHN